MIVGCEKLSGFLPDTIYGKKIKIYLDKP